MDGWPPNREKKFLCPALPIVPSPVINGYRNKCEFTIGVDVNGSPVVGMTCGKYVEGVTTVEVGGTSNQPRG